MYTCCYGNVSDANIMREESSAAFQTELPPSFCLSNASALIIRSPVKGKLPG